MVDRQPVIVGHRQRQPVHQGAGAAAGTGRAASSARLRRSAVGVHNDGGQPLNSCLHVNHLCGCEGNPTLSPFWVPAVAAATLMSYLYFVYCLLNLHTRTTGKPCVRFHIEIAQTAWVSM